ncbi:hypothetical protein BO70DRAFT_386529 [Aspergillus heteromorphus CBS 117.55]|uniref:TPR-like protein n=1 Tax=Aspergillus heteromorphus CBS 117.55 TaxID=1448321 RepID=A0A317WJ00_9EURO|nr:uncharacterized protein BO70DRAFT_386529 [Aspergillus heteromorphus CBS 117.55]PWY86289.1 hypothetical protein BO70DRAFT_386529 [Aspergillus heteromorphus CBS 117.55]
MPYTRNAGFVSRGHTFHQHIGSTWKTPDVPIFWIHANTVDRFKKGYTDILDECNIQDLSDKDHNNMSLVKRWLENHHNQKASKPAVPLVEESRILKYLPESPNGSILITTRNRAAGVRFTRSVAQNIVESVLGGDCYTRSNMNDLARLLDYLPLAIVQAASFMQENVLTVTMNLLCEPFETLGRDSETPNALATTLIITLGHIKSHEPKVIDALCLSLLKQRFDKVLAFSLITANGDGQKFSIHRLVQLTVRKWLLMERNFHDKAVEAMDILAEHFPNAEYENWAIFLSFMPELHGKLLRRRLYLQEGIAYYLWSQNRTNEAEKLDLLIVEENKKEFGMDHPETLERQDRLTEAEELDFFVMMTRKRLLGSSIYRKQCRYKEAEALVSEALEQSKSVYDEEHEISIDAIGHLGAIYSHLGRWKEAEEFTLKDWNWHKQNYGPDHLWSLNLANRLATIYHNQNKLQGGKELAIQTVCEEQLGPENQTTRDCKQGLIDIYIGLEDWKGAEGLSLEVLEEDLKMHGPTHCETFDAKQQLSCISYWVMGDIDKAAELNNTTIADCLHTFGPEHAYTLKFTALF